MDSRLYPKLEKIAMRGSADPAELAAKLGFDWPSSATSRPPTREMLLAFLSASAASGGWVREREVQQLLKLMNEQPLTQSESEWLRRTADTRTADPYSTPQPDGTTALVPLDQHPTPPFWNGASSMVGELNRLVEAIRVSRIDDGALTLRREKLQARVNLLYVLLGIEGSGFITAGVSMFFADDPVALAVCVGTLAGSLAVGMLTSIGVWRTRKRMDALRTRSDQ
jgi:hypothetical protein